MKIEKIADAISFIIFVGLGFMFQYAFIEKGSNPYFTIVLPLGFCKLWWDAKKNSK